LPCNDMLSRPGVESEKMRLTLVAPLALVGLFAVDGPTAGAYTRNVGLLPQPKAEADAGRLGDVIEAFQRTHLQGKCVSVKGKHGVATLWNLVNEEGRGLFPPRTRTEIDLYRKLKAAMARGEKLDPARVLELGLEANLRNGKVDLQETFLSIHNVVRLLARPETWWCNSKYTRGRVIWTPLGEAELTRGRWEPGWRGMTGDSIYPIVADIVGHQAVSGGQPTLAEIRNNAWSQQSPEQQRQHQAQIAAAQAARRKTLEAHEAERDRQQLQRDRFAAEVEAARQALASPSQGHIRGAAVRVGLMQDALGSLDSRLGELRATIRRLTLELSEDITTNARDNLYTRHLFALDGGVFTPLYGAEEAEGNGGNWYYFWLGAMAWSAQGTAAEAFGSRYEAAQKWMGSEEEYARGLIQLSHFSGGAELARQASRRFEKCKEDVPGGTPVRGPATAEKTGGTRAGSTTWRLVGAPKVEADPPPDPRSSWSGGPGTVTLVSYWAGGYYASPLTYTAVHTWSIPEELRPGSKVEIALRISGIRYEQQDRSAGVRGYNMSSGLAIAAWPDGAYEKSYWFGDLRKGIYDGSPDYGSPEPVEAVAAVEVPAPSGPDSKFALVVSASTLGFGVRVRYEYVTR
jgi:hypothetical protein